MRRGRTPSILVLPFLFLTGCLTATQQMQLRTEERDFLGARALLNKQDQATPDGEAAKEMFTRAIEREFGLGAARLAADGHLEDAVAKAADGIALAPWSLGITTDLADLKQRLARVRAAEEESQEAEVSTPPAARHYLSEIAGLGRDYKASQLLKQKRGAAKDTLQRHWISELEQLTFDGAALLSDLQLIGAKFGVCTSAAIAFVSPQSAGAKVGTLTSCANSPEGQGIEAAARRWMDAWTKRNLPTLVANAPADLSAIAAFEELKSGLSEWADFDCSLAQLHLKHAELRAGMGIAATLALLDAERASSLCPTRTNAAPVRAKALATLSAQPPLEASITIDADPKADPQLYSIVRKFFIGGFLSANKGPVTWTFGSIGRGGGENTIYLRNIDLRVPNANQLESVRSSYFSHTEEVPNPNKRIYKSRLAQQKYEVDAADSAVDSAIRIHNISPSEWTLQTINRERRRYAQALNEYNQLVDLYNATPSTTTRSVYMPYEFSQGTVQNGWRIGYSYDVSGRTGNGTAQFIDTAFARMGTNYADQNPAWRRDVNPALDVSVERLIVLLERAIQQMLQNVAPSLGGAIPLPRTIGLDETETTVARWLLHPWGPTPKLGEALGVPAWARAIGASVRLPERKVAPPATKLPPSRPPPTKSVEALAEWSRGLVGKILGPNGLASGALISGDGLFLTCAHCLEGEPTHIQFTEASWAGDYPLQVIFVNNTDDVALVRAVGLRTPRWFGVRLDDDARKGEAIVAMGNMSLRSHSTDTTEAGITSGVVADPDTELASEHRLIADIAIASGSSGGPIISMTDGQILGVVTVVIPSGVFDDRAQSKSVCGAFPARLLGLSVGLSH